jgi:hypothetical protein
MRIEFCVLAVAAASLPTVERFDSAASADLAGVDVVDMESAVAIDTFLSEAQEPP